MLNFNIRITTFILSPSVRSSKSQNWHSCPVISKRILYSIKDVRTLGGRGVRQKWTNTDRGRRGLVSQMWTSECPNKLRKKIISTIFVKYLANHACVSHLLRGQPHLLKCYYRNCLIGTHTCVHPVSE